MNDMSKTPAIASGLTRRSFLMSTGVAAVGVSFGVVNVDKAMASTGDLVPNGWINIAPSGTITLFSPAAEMGQGVKTSLPLILAEELDANWDDVAISQSATGSGFGNPRFGGLQVTGGSQSTQGYYILLRQAGAQARRILLMAAAEQWGVPIDELTTEPSMVVHAASNRSISYGDLAATAKVPAELPEIAQSDLKPADQFRLIGQDVDRVDVPSKVDGSAQYGLDIQQDGMVYGMIVRAPATGTKPVDVDDAAAKAIPGVIAVIPLDYGVAVVAETFYAAKTAREALEITWTSDAVSTKFNSPTARAEFRAVAEDETDSEVLAYENHGDPIGAFANAAKTVAITVSSDHVSHATMEPMNTTAKVAADGKSATVWSPTQAPSFIQFAGAGILETAPDAIEVHSTLLGGGYGRRADVDYAVDALLLAKITGQTVKVVWTREDDIKHDMYRPMAVQRLTAALDANDNIVGWKHRVVADSVFARANPASFEQAGGLDGVSTEGQHSKYGFPSVALEYRRMNTGINVGFWRAVGSGYTKFGVEMMLDEISDVTGKDPLALRLELMANNPRAQAVLKRVAEMSGWGREMPEGRGLGLAYSDTWETDVAQVAEVSLDRETGEIKVHEVWVAVDPGTALQPRNIAAQMESSIAYGISCALRECIDFEDGVVQQNNFYDYEPTRMSDMPLVNVDVIPSGGAPGGIGEAGLPPIAPAIASAVRSIAGAKLRDLPMTPTRVLAALKA